MFLTHILEIFHLDDYAVHQHLARIYPTGASVLYYRKSDGSAVVRSNMPPMTVGGDVTETSSSIYADGKPHMFRVRVNAAYREIGSAKKRSIPDDKLSEWVKSRLEWSGISVEHMMIVPEGMHTSMRKDVRTFHNSVEVTFVGTVVDAGAFAHAYANGIGQGKAFGFGMLMSA